MESKKNFIISHRLIGFILIACYLFTIPFDNYKILPLSFSTLFGLSTIFYITTRQGIYNQRSYFILLLFSASLILVSMLSYSFKYAITFDELVRNILLILVVTLFISALLSLTGRSQSNFNKILTLFQYSSFIAVATGFLELIAFVLWGKLIFNSIHIQKFDFLSFPVLRIKGTYFDPNYFSVICFLGYFVTDIRDTSNLLIKKIFKIYFFAAAFFSFSRMGIFAFIAYKGMKTFLKARTKTKLIVVAIIIAIVPFIELGFHPIQKTIEIIVNSSQGSSENRLSHITEGISLIWHGSLLGYGLGYVPSGGYTHNTFLQTGLYGGIMALALLISFYINSVLNLYKLNSRISQMALSAIISIFIVQMLLSYLLIKYLWFFFYILIQIPSLEKK